MKKLIIANMWDEDRQVFANRCDFVSIDSSRFIAQ